ncbi:MAG: WYL domain-containing protein [Lachnospiraceae bacterium]|nr:WYL domain-containing protein [Lachnospiraceae bacterium]
MSEKVHNEKENESQLRILYLYQILLKYSDQEHPMSTKELLQAMQDYHQISMHRTTLPKDIAALREAGVEIIEVRARDKKYFLADRMFEVAELKLLIDAVESSKFISERKSEELTDKLIALSSVGMAARLKRNSLNAGRIKSENEKSYYIVDAVNDAINSGKRISFCYTDIDMNKQKVMKNGGEPYILSPYSLLWNGDYYYLIGYNHGREQINTFRVDRIDRQPEILEEEIQPMPEDFSLETYARMVFRMFDTEEPVKVTLYCERPLMKHVIDQFGMDVETEIVDENGFIVHAEICASPTFYRWVFGWNGKMKILAPDSVLEEYHEMARKALE